MRNVNTTNALLNVVANCGGTTLDAGMVVTCASTHVPAIRLYPASPAMSALRFSTGKCASRFAQSYRQGSLEADAIEQERIAEGFRQQISPFGGSGWLSLTRLAQSFGQRRQGRSKRQSSE